MQDSQDNTFPIPATGGTDPNAAAGPVPAPDNQGLGFTPAPAPTGGDNGQIPANDSGQTPVAPDWTNQASADAAALPPGSDNFSINTPPSPSSGVAADLPLSPSPAPDTGVAIDPNASNPVNTDSGIPPTPIPQEPIADTTLGSQQPELTAQPEQTQYSQPQPMQQDIAQNQPMPAYDPNTIQAAPVVPVANTLDLSNQPIDYSQSQPATGVMQPGVEIAPQAGIQSDPMSATDIGGIPPDFGSSYNTEATDMMGVESTKGKLPMKLILIGAGALGLIIILSLVLVFVNRNQRTPAVDLNQAVVEETQKPEESTTPAEIPEGYKKVERDCFSFGVLLPTTINFTPTTCKITAKFGSVSQYNININPVTDSVTDLQALVDQAKVGTITSQEDIKLNGVEAKKVVQKVNGLDQQNIVVIPSNKTYQLEGKAINGFIITTSYNDDTSKTASDNLISTWAWK